MKNGWSMKTSVCYAFKNNKDTFYFSTEQPNPINYVQSNFWNRREGRKAYLTLAFYSYFIFFQMLLLLSITWGWSGELVQTSRHGFFLCLSTWPASSPVSPPDTDFFHVWWPDRRARRSGVEQRLSDHSLWRFYGPLMMIVHQRMVLSNKMNCTK